MRLVYAILVLVIAHGTMVSATHAGDTSLEQVYTMLRQNGALTGVVVSETFDLSKVAIVAPDPAAARPEFTFKNVSFQRGFTTAQGTIDADMRFVNCQFDAIEAKGTTWRGNVHFEKCGINGPADFRFNQFTHGLRFHYVAFEDDAWFTHSRFAATAEFLHCTWKFTARFSDTRFSKTAKFNFSTVKERAVFQATVFEGDASFINFEAKNNREDPAEAHFLNVLFKGDAEFRLSEFDLAQFSNRNHLTVFYQLADFRGSAMETGRFDYAEFRGLANFVKAKFGKGGLSFKNAGISGPRMILDSVECAGAMNLSGPYIPTLHFRWSEIGPAVLRADPDPADLELLRHRALALGQTRAALKLAYFKHRSADQRVWADPGAKAAKRAWAMFNWLLWGWPTGYGTDFVRIVLIAGICWIICAMPPLLKRGLLIQLPLTRNGAKNESKRKVGSPRRYSPVYVDHLPTGAAVPLSSIRQIGLALTFTFGLMFKVGGGHTAYLESTRRMGRHGFERYFLVVWTLGSLLLALLAYTLAKTNPLLQKVIGEVIF